MRTITWSVWLAAFAVLTAATMCSRGWFPKGAHWTQFPPVASIPHRSVHSPNPAIARKRLSRGTELPQDAAANLQHNPEGYSLPLSKVQAQDTVAGVVDIPGEIEKLTAN